MDKKRADKVKKEFAEAMLNKKHLILSVEVENEGQGEMLMEWMYSDESPVDLKLIEIAWDKVAVSKEEAEFIDKARAIFNPY